MFANSTVLALKGLVLIIHEVGDCGHKGWDRGFGYGSLYSAN